MPSFCHACTHAAAAAAAAAADNSANTARLQTFKGFFPFGANFAITNTFGGKTKDVLVCAVKPVYLEEHDSKEHACDTTGSLTT
jgi:hypothetical protein